MIGARHCSESRNNSAVKCVLFGKFRAECVCYHADGRHDQHDCLRPARFSLLHRRQDLPASSGSMLFTAHAFPRRPAVGTI